MNLFKLVKYKILKIFNKYIYKDLIEKFPVFYIKGSQLLPPPLDGIEEDKLLHQQCHKFYRQRMNHMEGFDDLSKISIFNTAVTERVSMSVGQHYVGTIPTMKIMMGDGFCLHIDKGFGLEYKYKIRQKMNKNLSQENRKYGMCIEYADSYEKLKKEYEENQKKSFDIISFFQ